ASGTGVKDCGTVVMTVSDKDKNEIVNVAARLKEVGYNVLATEDTAKTLQDYRINAETVSKIGGENDWLTQIQNNNVQIVINTMTKGKAVERDGFQIRRASVENGVPCLTSLDTAEALTSVIESMTFTMKNM